MRLLAGGMLIAVCLSDASAETAGGAWQVRADRLIYEDAGQIVRASGHAQVRQGDVEMRADEIVYDRTSGRIQAAGHVTASDPESRLSGSRLAYDSRTRTGVLEDGVLFLSSRHFWIRAGRIEKTGETTFLADDVRVTACEGEVPDWQIGGARLSLELGGYGRLTHAAFWARRFPLLYAPFLWFPVKEKRQTGLLPPDIGYSTRNGVEYLQPLFMTLGPSADATVYLHAMTKRGVKTGGEYRYRLAGGGTGVWLGDYFRDRKVDDGTDGSEDWGYLDGDDTWLRPNHDRYWIRMKTDHPVGRGWTLRADVDVVSDPDYLKAFRSGIRGYRDTADQFASFFDRGLDAYDDTVRSNRFGLYRDWTLHRFSAEVLWNDNVVARRLDTDDATLQKVPQLRWTLRRHALGKGPVFCEAGSTYAFLYQKDPEILDRDDGFSWKINHSHRLDTFYRLSIPLTLDAGVTLDPYVGARLTQWYADEQLASGTETAPVPAEGYVYHHRELWEAGAAVSTELFRVFKTAPGNADRMKHSLYPRIRYRYVPDVDQDDFPEMETSVDRIDRQSLLTLDLEQVITLRMSGKEGGQGRYHEWIRFQVCQGYDFFEADEPDPDNYRNALTQEPFLPLEFRLMWNGLSGARAQVDGTWSNYAHEWLKLDAVFRVRLPEFVTWYGNYSYLRDPLETIDLREPLESERATDTSGETVTIGCTWESGTRWWVFGEMEKDLLYQDMLRIEWGLTVNAACWHAAFTAETNFDTPRDHRYQVRIRLRGLDG